MIEDVVINGKVVGKVNREDTGPKYNHLPKVKFIDMVGEDAIYVVGRSTKKRLYFMSKLLDASTSIDFNNSKYRLLFLSLVDEELITIEQANEIMGAPHE
ncbi:hypothetical protein [Pseudoteredinibacter isoporae]|uniref:hypothetical protein n=1 Tax=Pseudoteredinibacter isoporae TaxID=570281 RepID=UPI003107AE76